jgi:hypothetical protein
MGSGDNCVVEWYVNATGNDGEVYEFYSEYLSFNFSSLAAETRKLNVTIVVLDTVFPLINFTDPTPANGTKTEDTNATINISIYN